MASLFRSAATLLTVSLLPAIAAAQEPTPTPTQEPGDPCVAAVTYHWDVTALDHLSGIRWELNDAPFVNPDGLDDTQLAKKKIDNQTVGSELIDLRGYGPVLDGTAYYFRVHGRGGGGAPPSETVVFDPQPPPVSVQASPGAAPLAIDAEWDVPASVRGCADRVRRQVVGPGGSVVVSEVDDVWQGSATWEVPEPGAYQVTVAAFNGSPSPDDAVGVPGTASVEVDAPAVEQGTIAAQVTDLDGAACGAAPSPGAGATVTVVGGTVQESTTVGPDGVGTVQVPEGTYAVTASRGDCTSDPVGVQVAAGDVASPQIEIPDCPPSPARVDLAAAIEGPGSPAVADQPFDLQVTVSNDDDDGPGGLREFVVTREAPPVPRTARGRRTPVRTRTAVVGEGSVGGGLCPGVSVSFTVTESGAPAGDWTYRVRLDRGDADQSNDTATAAVTVEAAPEPAAPVVDLALAVEQSHATLPPGATMTYEVSLANLGEAGVSNAAVRNHVSTNLDLESATGSHGFSCAETGTNLLGLMVACEGGDLPPGATAEIEIRASLPETAQPGHTIQFVSRADPDEAIDEIDEGNNHQVVQATSGSPPPPDLAVSIEQSREVLPAGKSIRYRVSIANEGGTTASEIYVRSRISPNLDFVYAHGSDQLTCSPGGTNAAGLAVECTGGVVEPGGSALIEIVGELPATANSGHELRFVAWADPDDAIEEDDEGNNHQTVIATTGEPVLVEYVVHGRDFAQAAHEAGWSSYASKVEGSLTSACNIYENGVADFNNVGLPNPRFLTCDYMYFSTESLRLAEPWTLVSVDVSFNPGIDARLRGWRSRPRTGSDDISFSFRLRSMRHFPGNGAAIDRVTLRGPEGADWRDALE